MREGSSYGRKLHMFMYHASNAKLKAFYNQKKFNINFIFSRSEEQFVSSIFHVFKQVSLKRDFPTIHEATESTI